jgi:lysylphosphatidylglycerol synthetase-like protein (DUF2156 family)
MKKFIFLFSLLATLFFPTTSFALNLGNQYTENARVQAGYGAADETTLSQTIGSVIKTALSLVGTIFLGLTVYAGFLWMTASGDESKVEKAQSIIRSAVIGLIIALGAYGITNFVVGRIVEKTVSVQQ